VHALIEKKKLQTKLVKTDFQGLFFMHNVHKKITHFSQKKITEKLKR
jgi:hypothetical protein